MSAALHPPVSVEKKQNNSSMEIKEIDHFRVIQFHGEMIPIVVFFCSSKTLPSIDDEFSIPLAISGDCRAVRLRTLPLDGSAKVPLGFKYILPPPPPPNKKDKKERGKWVTV